MKAKSKEVKPFTKPKAIKTPTLLFQYFNEYVDFIKAKPILKQDYVGKDGMEVNRKFERPLTMVGFENYCFTQGIINDLKQYFANTDKRYTAYIPICTRIKDMIKQDQIEGGMAGIYNPSITQRLNGLVEKTQNENENTNTNVEVTLKL